MNRRSSIIIAAGLVFALMAGTDSRAVTLHQSSGAAPVRIVVKTASPTTGAPTLASTERESE